MKKRGFTLIELMAVIVILGIISVIVVPMILTSIKNARKGAAEVSFENILKAAELYVSQASFDGIKKARMDGNTNLLQYLDYDGERPSVGVVNARADNSIAMTLLLNGMCYSKTYSGDSLVKSQPVNGTCTLPEPYNIVTKKFTEPLDSATFELLTYNQFKAINTFTSTMYNNYCEWQEPTDRQFEIINGNPTIPESLIMPSSSNKKYKIDINSLNNLSDKKTSISKVSYCLYNVKYAAFIKINIPSGNNTMEVNFDISSYNFSSEFRVMMIRPGTTSRESDIRIYTEDNYTYDNSSHITFSYEANGDSYAILIVDLEAYYTYYGDTDNHDGIVIKDLSVTYGGLTGGDSSFILEGDPYIDEGIETQTGVAITDTKYINRISAVPNPTRNGKYNFKYELETLSGFKTFVRNVYVGYDSLYTLSNQLLYINYVPDNLILHIKDTHADDYEIFEGYTEYGCEGESVLLYFMDESNNIVYSKNIAFHGTCRYD